MFNLMTASIRATMLRWNARRNSQRCPERSHASARVRIVCHELESRLNPVTITVLNALDSNTTIPVGSLREALTKAMDGDIIDFKGATFPSGSDPILLKANLPAITKNISIIGFNNDFERVKIDGFDAFKALHTSSAINLNVQGLTIRNTPVGGIALANGDFTFSNLDLFGNSFTGDGGAISVVDGNLTLNNVNIHDNTITGNGGAIFVSSGNLTITDSTISNCTASADGGAIDFNRGNLTLTNVEISDCMATNGRGGAIAIARASLDTVHDAATITGSDFSGCSAPDLDNNKNGFGGAVFITNSDRLTVNSTTFSSNYAKNGGGGIAGDKLTIAVGEKSSFNNCTADGSGGGINLLQGTLTIEDTKFTDCKVAGLNSHGGGVSLELGDAYFADSEWTGCETQQFGGGIYFKQVESLLINIILTNCVASSGGGIHVQELGAGELIAGFPHSTVMENATVQGCSVNGDGGGMALHSPRVVVRNSLIENCQAVSGFLPNLNGAGGGLHYVNTIGRMFEITNTIIRNNTASAVGGGLYSNGGGPLIFESTIQDNVVTNGPGGGIHILSGNVNNVGLRLYRSTVSGNVATGVGGGIDFRDTFLSIKDSTIDHNTSGSNGGGLDFTGISNDINATTMVIENATFAYNQAGGTGGGININKQNNGMLIRFSTIVENTAFGNGGGIAVDDSQPLTGYTPQIDIAATVISGNTDGTNIDEVLIPEAWFTTVNFYYDALLSKDGIAPDNSVIGFDVNFSDMLSYDTHADLLLEPLAMNGGPTKTLLPHLEIDVKSIFGSYIQEKSSPLIDFIPEATFTVFADQRGQARPQSIFNTNAPDIGAVELVDAIPTVTVDSFTVNGGDVQRSRLTTVTIQFSSPVPIELFTLTGAITLTRTHATKYGSAGTVVQTGANGHHGRITFSQISGYTSELVLTFANANGANATAGVENGSLADGRWQLAIPMAGFSSTSGDTTLRRLFGDIDNSGTIDSTDQAAFNAALTTYNAAFDFNFDSTIDSDDEDAFDLRFGLTL